MRLKRKESMRLNTSILRFVFTWGLQSAYKLRVLVEGITLIIVTNNLEIRFFLFE
jgi:hypothetical protein